MGRRVGSKGKRKKKATKRKSTRTSTKKVKATRAAPQRRTAMPSRSEVLEAARRKGRENLFFLAKEVLGYRELADFHADICADVVKHPRSLYLLPRGHFKTTILTVALSIYDIINDPNTRILINSDILGNSRAFLREIKGHIERNDDFRTLYGDLVGDYWQSDGITISTRTANHKEPTISLGAIGNEKTSGHYKRIINDDLVGLKDMISEAKRRSTRFYYDTFEDLILPGGAITSNGTRWHTHDLYKHIIDNFRDYVVNDKYRRAILANGRPLFPERFALVDLLEKQRKNPIMFSAQNFNEPLPLEGQLYSHDELKFFDPLDVEREGMYMIGVTDPALGKSKKSDYVCILTLGVDEAGTIYVWDCYLERAKPDEACRVAAIHNKTWKWDRAGGEANGFQELFVEKFEAAIGMHVERIITRGNKDMRIRGMRSWVLDNVRFRKDWARKYPTLIEQLTLYPQAENDDGPDTLELGLNMVKGGTATAEDSGFVAPPKDHYKANRRSVLS